MFMGRKQHTERTDFNATLIYTNGVFDTKRKLANRAIKAMSDIQFGIDQGTIRSSFELASSELRDGRTLIQTIYEDGYVKFNDGYYVVEIDDYILYVDFTSFAVNDMIQAGIISPDGIYKYMTNEGLKSYGDFEK